MTLLASAIAAAPQAAPGDVDWETVAPGMDLARIRSAHASDHGDSTVTVLRMDPEQWELVVLGISHTGDPSGRTAREWAREHGLTAAINAGMFATDHKTHIGYQRAGEHVNNGRFNDYQSIVAFDRRSEEVPRFRIFDVDAADFSREKTLRDYSSVIQNLRLIKRPGENRWSRQKNRWSEAALGEDRQGRVLFLFCRSPFSMHDLNHELLSMDIGLVAAQHLEGGPEAQLYLEVGSLELELVGSYETQFREDDGNRHAWKVPNILGVRPRPDSEKPGH